MRKQWWLAERVVLLHDLKPKMIIFMNHYPALDAPSPRLLMRPEGVLKAAMLDTSSDRRGCPTPSEIRYIVGVGSLVH